MCNGNNNLQPIVIILKLHWPKKAPLGTASAEINRRYAKINDSKA